MQRTKIKYLFEAESPRDSILIKGWVRTRRNSKTFSFLEINDGSCLTNLQVIVDNSLAEYEAIAKLSIGSAVAIKGALIASKGKGQKWEVAAREVVVISLAQDNYPLQKKRHTDEFLRSIAHLRPQTNKYGAVFRIRSELSFAVHSFFKARDFHYIHTPIITGSDCEGAGELFRVTAFDLDALAASKTVDNRQDFFGAAVNLTVSGQLSAEMLALALGDVYTFGPTFRAENSNTRRHVAEFWMIEPEMAFCELEENMDLGQSIIQYLVHYAMEHCSEDIALFGRFVDQSLMERLKTITDFDFIRLSYREAISLLKKADRKFVYPVSFGVDLQAEHERYLTEAYFKRAVILYNYPKTIKPFYMRSNDDGETVAAMDILLPGIGEIIGGSQREERLDVLEMRIKECGMALEPYWWYLDSRRFRSVPHSGFGMGFERLLMLITGIRNIRDVIPFPRTPGSIEF